MTLPDVELPPHIRAVLARAGAEDGRRTAQGDLDRDCRAAGCDCEYCVAFGRALILDRLRAAAEGEEPIHYAGRERELAELRWQLQRETDPATRARIEARIRAVEDPAPDDIASESEDEP